MLGYQNSPHDSTHLGRMLEKSDHENLGHIHCQTIKPVLIYPLSFNGLLAQIISLCEAISL
jgi:hypothetical protein